MAGRKSLSKRTRFEIFKRDGFKCLYCGATPAQKVLRVDHVKPVAEGGGDDPTNLVTSCFDCNAGKGPVPLDQQKHRAGFATEADKEHAEQIRAWLAVQKEIEEARREVADELERAWRERLGDALTEDMYNRFARLAREWDHDILLAAMEITARKFGCAESYSGTHAVKAQKYFHGILRNWREGRGWERPT
jgi:hypothetical protein